MAETLGQRTGELADELDLAAVDPSVEEVVRMSGDHVAVAERPRSDPRVGELPAVADVHRLRWARGHHGSGHQIAVGRIGLLR